MSERKQRVGLFTSFHPDIGGGAVNLRSIIAWLADIEITWFHLGPRRSAWPNSIWLGSNLIGGPILGDLSVTPLLLAGAYQGRICEMVARVKQENYDAHWVVAMNEGIVVGNLLANEARGTCLHVSVQDDQAGWMWARSRRYKWMAWMVHWQWNKLLRSANSVDVTSEGMRRYYLNRIGIETAVAHVYVERLPIVRDRRPTTTTVKVGHIGSVYNQEDFSAFLRALRAWTSKRQLKLELLMIGFSGTAEWLRENARPDTDEIIQAMVESAAIQRLAECDFVYAMYPFKRSARIFRQTSLPTKLSTYVQVQRPILAHTPADSTLAELVGRFELGVVADALDEPTLFSAIERIVKSDPARAAFEMTRDTIFGRNNVETIRDCLWGAAKPPV